MFERVLVAVDGSECADQAFGVARSMVSRQLGCELTVVHVTPMVQAAGGELTRAHEDEELVDRLEQAVAKLAAEGVKAQLLTPAVYRGGPAFAIAEAADQVDAEVILVGNRGTSPHQGAVLGGVPVRLLQTAFRPVLVIPMPGDALESD